MDIVTVDGSDAEQFGRFHALVDGVQRAASEFPTVMGEDEWRVLFTAGGDRRWTGRIAVVDGVCAGAMFLQQNLLENTDTLELGIYVDPPHRRAGVGTALLRHALEYARAEGRSVLTAEIETPYDGATVASSGTAFAERHGFVRKHLELHQVRRLPIGADELDRLTPRHPGYELVCWDESCPDDWVDQFCAMLSLFGTQVPLGDLELETARWTPQRLRTTEARRIQQGRFGSATVAVAPDGTLAGYTEMGGAASRPGRLFQWGTMVRPEHRGHRLGIALKVRNLRRLQARVSGPAVLHTWNAPENGPMIAVNEQLGFQPYQNLCLYQRATDG